jgi:predicted dithiol-disulfide oxidoreductase (DUF899 family)
MSTDSTTTSIERPRKMSGPYEEATASANELVPAVELASKRQPRIKGESNAYAQARQELLAEEIRVRRKLDALAAQRRRLPPGPVIEKDYRFIDPTGNEVGLADIFGDKDVLLTYFWMYGPQRLRPCPMCTNFLGPLDANAADLEQRIAVAVFGRSPVERQFAFRVERGWRNLKFYQTVGDDYALDFGGLDTRSGWEFPVLAVFCKEQNGGEANVRLFWMGEISGEMADPGQDPRGAPDPAPLWTMLDLTPDGRGTDWYPKLEY